MSSTLTEQAEEGAGAEQSVALLPIAEPPPGSYTAVSSGGLGDLRLGDVGAGFKRYRPVIATVIAILLIAAVVPGASLVDTDRSVPVAANDWDSGGGGNGATDVETTDEAPAEGAEGSAPDATASPRPDFGGAASPSPGGSGGGDAGPSPAPSPAPAPGFTPPPAAPPSGDGPSGDGGDTDTLRVVQGGWATTAAGTPLATAGVPDGGLPVGKRIGRDDKHSFIRLEGSGTTLQLATIDEGGGNRFEGNADVQICLITESGWEGGEAMSFDDAPESDCSNAVTGTVDDAGVWTFNLLAFGEPGEAAGFALLPGPDAGVDFQVTFSVED